MKFIVWDMGSSMCERPDGICCINLTFVPVAFRRGQVLLPGIGDEVVADEIEQSHLLNKGFPLPKQQVRRPNKEIASLKPETQLQH